MQIAVKVRETLTGAVTAYSSPIDISNSPIFTGCLIAHAVSGTSPTFDVSFETSDDLETWDALTATFQQVTAASVDRGVWPTSGEAYGRYIRAVFQLAGTSPLVNFSLYRNTFQST
jgi:hypothetical protein